MQGIHLQNYLAQYTGYCTFDPSTGAITGKDSEVFQALATALNLTYSSTTETSLGGKDANGTWIGVLGRLLAGQADVTSCSMLNSLERSEAFDFCSPTVSKAKLSLVMARPK